MKRYKVFEIQELSEAKNTNKSKNRRVSHSQIALDIAGTTLCLRWITQLDIANSEPSFKIENQ